MSVVTEGTMKSTALCKKGLHRMTATNTYQHPAKGAECRECKRTYMRDYMRVRRSESARR
jgi:hypothetical protein